MSIELVEIANTDAYKIPEIRDFFSIAFAEKKQPDPDKVLVYLQDPEASRGNTVVLAYDDEKGWVGLAIVFKETWVFAGVPWVNHFFCSTTPARRSLMAWIVKWMEKNEEKVIRIMNMTGRSDEAHMRLFREIAKPTRVAGVIDYAPHALNRSDA